MEGINQKYYPLVHYSRLRLFFENIFPQVSDPGFGYFMDNLYVIL